MIQIIDKKRYNTETATKIYAYSNGVGSNDFQYLRETLYQTPKGNWFIQYDGGAMTQYARSCGRNSRCGDSGLKALTEDQAYAWLELHFQVDAIEQYFADRVQDA